MARANERARSAPRKGFEVRGKKGGGLLNGEIRNFAPHPDHENTGRSRNPIKGVLRHAFLSFKEGGLTTRSLEGGMEGVLLQVIGSRP